MASKRTEWRTINWTAMGVIIPAVIAAAGGAWWAFNSLFIEHIVVCHGEFESKCPATHSVFRDCGSSVEAWANSACYFHKSTRTHNTDGNHCGYDVTDITCIIRR